MATQIQVEDVEPRDGEMVGEAARRQVPGVAVLPEAVHEQDGRPGPFGGLCALAHHREGHDAPRHDDLLAKAAYVAPVDRLLDHSFVQDHVFARLSPRRCFNPVYHRARSAAASLALPTDENENSLAHRDPPHCNDGGRPARAGADQPEAEAEEEGRQAGRFGVRERRGGAAAPAARALASAAASFCRAAGEKAAAPSPPPPPEHAFDSSITTEDPSKRYFFVGLRYRGDVIPQFVTSLFVDRGATIYSNAIGVELDSRKDGFSQVFALTYQNYDTGNILFLQKNSDPTNAANYSVVHSGLGAIYASVDLLWSTPIANHLDFEYGLGVGLGVVFGTLNNNWVYQSPNGPYSDPRVGSLAECPSANAAASCQTGAHQNATVAKVGNYSEAAGIAGPKPILFPMVNIPQLGLRYKPIKQLEARLGVGFSLTGFWFGISADYGLEQPKDAAKASREPRLGGSF